MKTDASIVVKARVTERTINVTIQGVTPLLCNKFTDEAQEKASNGKGSSMMAGSNGTPREQAEAKLYLGADGAPVIPQPNLLRCLIDAGKFFKAGKSKVTTQKSSLLPACIELHEFEFPIVHQQPWSVDSRPIRNPATGGRRLCHRPRFDDWQLSFSITVDTAEMSENFVREIVDKAGRAIGLGDFRLDCKGPFGKFVVTSWVQD
jgi:hypothetical protein